MTIFLKRYGSWVQTSLCSTETDEEITENAGSSHDLGTLPNYQLARDRVRRNIVRPTRFVDESEVAFVLIVSER